MSKLTESSAVTVFYADHPPRSESAEYVATRRWLMSSVASGCYVCGGPVDLSHPETPADAHGLEDHHGGAIYVRRTGMPPVLVGRSLVPIEWAGGWAADPATVQRGAALVWHVEQSLADHDLGPCPVIATTADVMSWVDGQSNAGVKLCAAHHRGAPTQHTPDGNGHEAVGIHHVPEPIWSLQVTNDWSRFDPFAGTTGTVAVSPDPAVDGGVIVHHVDPAHPDAAVRRSHTRHRRAQTAHRLPSGHALSVAAHRER